MKHHSTSLFQDLPPKWRILRSRPLRMPGRLTIMTGLSMVGILGAKAATYYYISGTVSNTSSWSTERDGSGTAPANFSTAGNTFVIQNGQVATIASAWTVSGAGSGLLVEAGGSVNASANANLTLNLQAGASYAVTGSHTSLSFGTIDPDSTFHVNSGNFRPALAYGGLVYNIGGNATPGSLTTTGNFTITNTGTTSLVSSAAVTWNIGKDLIIDSSWNLANGTGSGVANIAGGLINNGTISKANASGSATINFSGTGSSDVKWGTHSANFFHVTIGSSKTITFIDALNLGTGTLGVDGVLKGNSSIAASSVTFSGTHDPGVGTTQAITSDVTYASGSIFSWTLSDYTSESGDRGNLYSAANVDGNLTIDSGAAFDIITTGLSFSDTFWQVPQTWSVFSVTGALAGLFEAGSGFSNAYGSFSLSSGGGGVNLNWSPVPEPSSALAGLLVAAGMMRRCRAS